ncbi:methylamine utilization protein [Hwanghaeella grinnelliae]|uniref:Methylamine utilization protein n=1 Tax=Hwanghaeella grinnelliae TaxID=2500179 RepID=A0A3S2VQH4_9PROT|nr:methylamine utilization protein [Hwanghaeella grinnelliae]RVU37899.1 methylamine utilization protein [Hwanghaeella grinnelliae]
MTWLLSNSIGFLSVAGAVCAWVVVAGPTAAADVNLSFVDSEGADVQDVVATLEVPDGQPVVASAPVEVEVNQYRQSFEPLVTMVPINSDVRFRNSDSFAHHVYSFSKAKSFEHRQSTSGVTEAMTLDKAGLIALGCNIHDHMLAYIYVSDTPYYGLSGKDGFVQMQDVPDGDYVLKIWHPRLKGKAIEKPVTVGGDTVEVRETLELKPPRKVKKSLYSR